MKVFVKYFICSNYGTLVVYQYVVQHILRTQLNA